MSAPAAGSPAGKGGDPQGLVAKKVFPNRNRAIQSAVAEKLARMERGRLASECGKLDPKFEKALADEGLGQELDAWSEY